MARICELTGTGPIKGSHIWRSGKAKKKGGIGTHVTAITKRRFMPNLQRVKALINGEVRYIRVTANALKKGLVVKAPKRNWKKPKPSRPEPTPSSTAKPSSGLRFFCGHFPFIRRIVARLSSRSESRFLRSSRLSNCTLPLPTASATFTRPFFQ